MQEKGIPGCATVLCGWIDSSAWLLALVLVLVQVLLKRGGGKGMGIIANGTVVGWAIGSIGGAAG